MSADGQRTKWWRNSFENFNRLSRVHERYRQTDDRRQTDGRTTTYSEHELEFTFANKCVFTTTGACLLWRKIGGIIKMICYLLVFFHVDASIIKTFIMQRLHCENVFMRLNSIVFTKQDIPGLLVVEGCRSFVKRFAWYTTYINIHRPYAIARSLTNVHSYFDTILLLSSFQPISSERLGLLKICEIHQNKNNKQLQKFF